MSFKFASLWMSWNCSIRFQSRTWKNIRPNKMNLGSSWEDILTKTSILEYSKMQFSWLASYMYKDKEAKRLAGVRKRNVGRHWDWIPRSTSGCHITKQEAIKMDTLSRLTEKVSFQWSGQKLNLQNESNIRGKKQDRGNSIFIMQRWEQLEGIWMCSFNMPKETKIS